MYFSFKSVILYWNFLFCFSNSLALNCSEISRTEKKNEKKLFNPCKISASMKEKPIFWVGWNKNLSLTKYFTKLNFYEFYWLLSKTLKLLSIHLKLEYLSIWSFLLLLLISNHLKSKKSNASCFENDWEWVDLISNWWLLKVKMLKVETEKSLYKWLFICSKEFGLTPTFPKPSDWSLLSPTRRSASPSKCRECHHPLYHSHP